MKQWPCVLARKAMVSQNGIGYTHCKLLLTLRDHARMIAQATSPKYIIQESHASLNPTIMLDLFDPLVKPRALYGSEICGIDFLNCNSTERLRQSMTSQCVKNWACHFADMSWVFIERLKAALSVNYVAGLYPNQTRLWQRRYSLMRQALLTRDNLDSFNKRKALSLSRAIYADEWNLCINREAKMRTYKLFKSIFVREPYLSIKNVKQRNAMARFRTIRTGLKLQTPSRTYRSEALSSLSRAKHWRGVPFISHGMYRLWIRPQSNANPYWRPMSQL